ncbi:pyridoxamine 5'-phosphate oxidase family protein [Limimaricola cinnabarinus]|uniref:Pyridoxamine 5'-phosphate oxidase n=1 Tax=Limimaricola cinnabarinus TaxID=1125964 RepID=A0A2G1MGJ2_9RHOB|nr:pyridoxamine 5'-phosphate oxidase family protein [Limimaricola cinnabarinus]PHP27807.1 pyridoxamine 5'-phosphate oxidase [Limimaricola cinnabarinus]
MRTVDSIEALEALYERKPSGAALDKVTDRLTPAQAAWIEASRFCVLSTVGPEGTDASPRGDDGPVVRIMDERTLLLPDWRGNNRMDSLRNIVRDGRVSLMFLVIGATIVMRVNGRAVLSDDPDLTARFAHEDMHPRAVIVVSVSEAYPQCARAVMRAGLWSRGDDSAGLPGIGEMLAEAREGFDGAAYDAQWPERAKTTMW